MSKNLIIVESPAKVKTIKKFLGGGYAVQASVGHIRDLPKREIGVDEEHDFAPRYVTITGKEKVVHELRAAAAKADTVYLAPDPDREGEAIAWHIAEVIRDEAKEVKRIQFNEITASAVKEALLHPRDIDPCLFDAQQARRVLDRLVGYKISPLLWKTVKRGISAGRVQSVALRLVVEREEERLAFQPEEYWLFQVMLGATAPPPFRAELFKIRGKKAVVPHAEAAEKLEQSLQGNAFTVDSVEEKERARASAPPFTTSSLQQTANQRLGFSAKRTMSTAQRLYEGMELGERGTVALITYMRTDSVRIADEAKLAAAKYIEATFGRNYLAPGGKGRNFKGKSSAQDAHEAIRPVDVNITPDDIKPHLTPDQYRLYNLIWARFLASQMAPALFHDTTVLVACGPTLWKAKGERLLFPGFLAVMPKNAAGSDEEESSALPVLIQGETLTLQNLLKEQKFTQPPPRYTEASLVRELEERGIGRPSTYAAIISTIQDREYVRQDNKHFAPTDLGSVVCSQLRDHFPRLMDVGFTAGMEDQLDQVAEGRLGWVKLLHDFNGDFRTALELASRSMTQVKSGLSTDVPCPRCGKPLLIRFGKSGEFLACSSYPECRHTTNFIRDEKGVIQPVEKQEETREVVGKCPQCGGDVVIKKSRTGSRFQSCANYPACTYAAPFSTHVPCPRCAQGMLAEKSSKRGKIFYACDQYPACDYALWDWPLAETCPECGSPVLTRKTTRAGTRIVCPNSPCRYTREREDAGEEKTE